MKVPFYTSNININAMYFKNNDNFYEKLVEKLKKNYRGYILLVNNIASSYKLALKILNTKRGDKILCAINSYPEISQAIRSFDSEPLFVDVSIEDNNIDYNSFVSTINDKYEKKFKNMILSHHNGVMLEMEQFINIANDYNIKTIEDFTDIALDIDVDIKGDIAIFSLNDRLNETVKGSFMVFKDKKDYMRAQTLINCGVVYENSALPYIYDIVDIGYDYNLSGLEAEIFYNNLIFYSSQRDKIASVYNQELDNIESVILPKQKEKMIFYNIIINRNRDFFAKKLIERGIEVGLYNIPLNFTTYYKNKYSYKVTSFPNALKSYQHILTLPCNNNMTIQEAEYISTMVKEIAQEHI